MGRRDNERAREGAGAAGLQASADALRKSDDPAGLLASWGLTGSDAVPPGQEGAFADELERQARNSRRRS